jgi:succinate-acetate transporter protein
MLQPIPADVRVTIDPQHLEGGTRKGIISMSDSDLKNVNVSQALATADPGPLGLAGFAMTTFVLSCFNANFFNASLTTVVLPLALFYGGLAQLLAGMWEFKRNNTFGALAFTSYGAFWMSFAAYVYFIAGKLPATMAHDATGLFLLSWTIFTFYMMIASFGTNGVIATVFVALFLTFAALTVGAFGNSSTMTHIGGYLGILTALLAWYGSFGGVANATFGKPVIPMLPFSRRA